jgi:hypothetical protein
MRASYSYYFFVTCQFLLVVIVVVMSAHPYSIFCCCIQGALLLFYTSFSSPALRRPFPTAVLAFLCHCFIIRHDYTAQLPQDATILTIVLTMFLTMFF